MRPCSHRNPVLAASAFKTKPHGRYVAQSGNPALRVSTVAPIVHWAWA